MRRSMILFMMASLLAGAASARAQALMSGTSTAARVMVTSPGPIAISIANVERRWVEDLPRMASAAGQAERPRERRWIARHPVLFGALVGAGAGAVMGYSLGQDCSGSGSGYCSSREGAALVGGALCAGAGAIVGLVVERVRD